MFALVYSAANPVPSRAKAPVSAAPPSSLTTTAGEGSPFAGVFPHGAAHFADQCEMYAADATHEQTTGPFDYFEQGAPWEEHRLAQAGTELDGADVDGACARTLTYLLDDDTPVSRAVDLSA